MRFRGWPVVGFVVCCAAVGSAAPAPPPESGSAEAKLWILQKLSRPEVPGGVTAGGNPIDAFIAAQYKAKGLKPVAAADKRTLLRRVYLDLIGLPPTPEQTEAFVADPAPDAYEKVVDKLLADDQYGVRYGRHWLDVLRYADVDERMIAAPGIYLWRDWVIRALNEDMPYDQFTRAQLTGYRSSERTQMTATGHRQPVEPKAEDVFALGFLARGHVLRDGQDVRELPITAVETVSTAFMGLTVGCAKCHNHMYDPIKQTDFYAMKALFDPLVLRKLTLATPEQIFAAGKAQEATEKAKAPIQAKIDDLVGPVKDKLYQDRLAMLPPDVQAVIRKAEKERTPAEQKIADDYFPVLRIDADKIQEVMTPEQVKQFKELQQELAKAGGGRRGGGPTIPTFWTVESDPRKELEPSYILTSGDPDRPEKSHEVKPGWPFAPANIDFREGRIAAFSDWLTAKENPMFARVAVNRLWQWHFGEGLQKTSSDFGKLGGMPSNRELLDWLAAEFVSRGYSMKQMTRLMVTSNTYKLSSDADPKLMSLDIKRDSGDTYLWHYRLQRLEAEPVWDSILSSAGNLDTAVGGPSFDPAPAAGRRGGAAAAAAAMAATPDTRALNRRAAYMVRGFSPSSEVMPNFLQAFDVDDGRLPCPMRTQTVTAPQGLFMMNSDEVDKASAKFADRLLKDSGGDLNTAIDLGWKIALSRPPSPGEKDHALTYVANDPAKLKGLAWLLFNLDEFIYVR